MAWRGTDDTEDSALACPRLVRPDAGRRRDRARLRRWHSLALIAFAAIGAIGACAVVAGAYWFLANRDVRRWLALILVIAAPALILVITARTHLLWVAIVAVALMLASAGTAKTALGTDGPGPAPATRPAIPRGTRS